MKKMTQYSIFGLMLLAMFAGNVEARWEYAQTRYSGVPASRISPNALPATDGVLRYRINPNSVVLTPASGSDAATLAFALQFKVGATDTDKVISSIGLRITYNDTAFGPRLNDPVALATRRGTPSSDANVQCRVVQGAATAATTNAYELSFTDTDDRQLFIQNQAADFIQVQRPEAELAKATTEWQDFLSFTCDIVNTDQEADLALSGTNIAATQVRRYLGGCDGDLACTGDGSNYDPDSDFPVQRSIAFFPDNQYRGFRLDGKTYVKRYDRFGDGNGLLIEFSKGIKTQLVNAHFATGNATLKETGGVVHTAGSSFATLVFENDPPIANTNQTEDDIRIAATANIVDEGDVALAVGNYVATLRYDARAPVVTGITKDNAYTSPQGSNYSRWDIVFDKDLFAGSVADGLCITEANGFCPEVNPAAEGTLRVVSAALAANETKTVQMVVDEGDGQVGGTRSIGVRRNALFTTDFAIAEDYQVALRNQLMIEDKNPPTLKVTAVVPGAGGKEGQALETSAKDADPVTYSLRFEVTVNEPVRSFNSAAGYVLLRIAKDGTLSTVNNTPTIAVSADGLTATLTYTGVSISRTNADETVGFTVGRGSGNALTDFAPTPRDPTRDGSAVIASGAPIAAGTGTAIEKTAIARTAQPLACAAITPNIGQRDLFLRLEGLAYTAGGFTLGGTAVGASAVSQVGTVGDAMVVRIALATPITASNEIAVVYRPTADAADQVEAACEVDENFEADADEDNVADALDADPFDASKTGGRAGVVGDLASAPGTSTWFHRSIVIPSVMQDGFSYISQSTTGPRVVTLEEGLTVHQYFGMPDNARLYKDKTGASCADALMRVESRKLISANISAACEDITETLLVQPATINISYYWVVVDNSGAPQSQNTSGTLVVYASVNFIGQNSYFLDEQSDSIEPIAISSEGGRSNTLPYSVGYFVNGASGVSPNANLTGTTGQLVGTYDTANNQPSAGMTGHYWIQPDSNGAGVWTPGATTIAPTAGGITIAATVPYAVGLDNYLFIATRGAEDPAKPLELRARLERMVGGSFVPVKAVVNDPAHDYRFAVSFASQDPIPTVTELALAVAGEYESELSEPSATAANLGFKITEDVPATIISIEVGMTINDIPIRRAYPLVAMDAPASLRDAITDANNDGVADGDVAGVSAQVDTKIAGQNITVSPTALLAAAQTASAMVQAEFDPADLLASENLQGALTFESIEARDGTALTRAVTFEVREVAPAVDEATREIRGGMAQIVYLYATASTTPTPTYVGKYNADSGKWEAFERGTHPDVLGFNLNQRDTWYAIDAPATASVDDCKGTGIYSYRVNHKVIDATTDGRVGFMSSPTGKNCILLIIRDNGPYDADSGIDVVDGVVIDPTSVDMAPLSVTSIAVTGGGVISGGGGGGAVNALEMLLLFALLLLLLPALITIRSRRA